MVVVMIGYQVRA